MQGKQSEGIVFRVRFRSNGKSKEKSSKSGCLLTSLLEMMLRRSLVGGLRPLGRISSHARMLSTEELTVDLGDDCFKGHRKFSSLNSPLFMPHCLVIVLLRKVVHFS